MLESKFAFRSKTVFLSMHKTKSCIKASVVDVGGGRVSCHIPSDRLSFNSEDISIKLNANH